MQIDVSKTKIEMGRAAARKAAESLKLLFMRRDPRA